MFQRLIKLINAKLNSSLSTTISPCFVSVFVLLKSRIHTLPRVFTSLMVHLRAMCSYGHVPDSADTVSVIPRHSLTLPSAITMPSQSLPFTLITSSPLFTFIFKWIGTQVQPIFFSGYGVKLKHRNIKVMGNNRREIDRCILINFPLKRILIPMPICTHIKYMS